MNKIAKLIQIIVTALALLPLCPLSVVSAFERIELKHDPFKRPSSLLAKPAMKKKASRQRLSPPKLVLKTVLLASDDSMANINGNLLRIGESIKGYKLVSIDAVKAVVSRNGKNYILFLEK